MNSPLKVLVAEDEPYNRKRLVRLLGEAGCQVVAELEDGPSVLEWLEKGGEADALFLDIQMPGLTGMDVVADLPRPFPIVFVTAYAEHAVRAFEQAAVDYLLKPVTADRLEKTLQRLRSTGETHGAADAAPKPSGPLRYPVKAGEGLIFLDLNRTSHFTFEDGIVWAHAGERYRTVWKSLSEAEAALAGRGLIRGHRHLLLRPEAVMGVRPGEFGRLLAQIAGGSELEISRGAAPALKKRLGLA
jgi:two-component system LytT family response regulator/two-component system response regulator AlgR